MNVINNRANLVTSMTNFQGSLFQKYDYVVWHKDCRLSLQKVSINLLPTPKFYFQPENKNMVHTPALAGLFEEGRIICKKALVNSSFLVLKNCSLNVSLFIFSRYSSKFNTPSTEKLQFKCFSVYFQPHSKCQNKTTQKSIFHDTLKLSLCNKWNSCI